MPRPVLFHNTAEKDVIRATIVRQFNAWLATRETATVSTLAGQRWIVEKQMASIAGLQSKRITIHNFERNAAKLYKYCPWKCKTRIPESVNFVGHWGNPHGLFRYIQTPNEPAFAWADYCGTPLKSHIRDFKKAIRFGDVLYVTFYLNLRYAPSVDSRILRKLDKLPTNERALPCVEVLESYIRAKVGDNFKRILFSSYQNGIGKRGASPMVTVGWHFEKDSFLGSV